MARGALAFEPELATLVEAPPVGPEWAYEVKYDGYRILAVVRGREVRLVSRNGKDWTERFPTLARAVRELGVTSAVLDGEVCVEKADGVTDFQSLQNALGEGRE